MMLNFEIMKTFTRFNTVVSLLHVGWHIYTKRGSGPSNPLHYQIWSPDSTKAYWIHPMTIEKLIRDKVVNGRDVEHGKYELRK